MLLIFFETLPGADEPHFNWRLNKKQYEYIKISVTSLTIFVEKIF